jgi:hypothetical protein
VKIDIDDFCIKFEEIYSFKEDQHGRKTCKWCRYHTEKMSKELRDAFNEGLPERIIENGFGTCKRVCKIAKKAGVETPYAIAIVNNGVCSMFKASILKAFFYQEFQGYQPEGNMDLTKIKPPRGGTGVVKVKE